MILSWINDPLISMKYQEMPGICFVTIWRIRDFPEGFQPQKGSTNLLRGQSFLKTAWKWRKFYQGGGLVRNFLCRSRSATGYTSKFISFVIIPAAWRFPQRTMNPKVSISPFMYSVIIGGSRGAWGTHAPLGVQILSISCSFRENLACSRPPSGKSWIRHW